jgi:uncharacterized Zn-finger protein
MTRSNRNRTQANTPDVPHPPPSEVQEGSGSPLKFIIPTEIVDLPSRGRFYGEGHPLHDCDTIEISHMTAKEEDILSSATLLKKGVALDKMIQSVIVDRRIKVGDLLTGDKNSLLVHSRIFGYGAEYSTQVTCPECGDKFEETFDLSELKSKDYEAQLEKYEIEVTEINTFVMTLPKSQYVVEFRLLTTKDEQILFDKRKDIRSLQMLEAIIISINDQADTFYLKRAISSLPIMDASILKRVYTKIMPDIDLSNDVRCPHCDEVSTVGVPLDANFFWPDI